MKDIKKTIYFGLVLVVAGLMCVQAGAISTAFNDTQMENTVQPTLLGNTLISVDNPDGDDTNPHITRNNAGELVVVYEKELDIFSKTSPVMFSNDNGETWQMFYELDSLLFDLTGILQSPDIVYNGKNDVYFWTGVDPIADMYNNMMWFLPGSLAAGGDDYGYAISGSGSTNYLSAAAACTENYFLALTTEDGYGLEQLFGLGYFTYPDYEAPPTMGGFYYDGNSEHTSAPAANLEMSVGDRIVIACETGDQITIKSTVSDEALLTNGEQQNGMDKYADIEQYPGEYLGTGSDPDVSCSGNKVFVVYADGGNVLLKYSTCNGDGYDPGFDWQTTTVDAGGFPAVHAQGNKVTVAYVKNNNLFVAVSEDGGATFGTPAQLNDEDGSVAAESGAVDLNDLGVVWVDTRNGAKDIYTAAGGAAPIIEVDSIGGGFGVSAVVKNSGEADAEGVECTITVEASLMILGGETTTTVDIPAGEQVTISSGLILGIGPATITVDAGGVIKTAEGTVLGPLVIGL